MTQTSRLALASVLALAAGGAALTAQRASRTPAALVIQVITRSASRPAPPAPAENFTGRVRVETLFEALDPHTPVAAPSRSSPAPITEAFTHLGFYAGWAKATKAITAVTRTLGR